MVDYAIIHSGKGETDMTEFYKILAKAARECSTDQPRLFLVLCANGFGGK